ncbi:MAG: AAA family ATPase [Lachnospiraceae bacterium]|nr:AAA family ATPase [Lachnospiraceae bacterium]
MKKKKKGFSYYRLFLILGVLALISVILILTVIKISDSKNLSDVFGKEALVKSETVYLVVILALLLPMVLIGLTIAIGGAKVGFTLFKEKTDEEEEGVRFRALVGLDREMADAEPPTYYNNRNLALLCEDFRNFAASKLKLYYDPEDIRRFVAGFAVSRLMVMQGLSGTGKTSLATAFGEYLGHSSTVISVQPMWKERSDVIGYFNEFTKQFSESVLLKTLYEASYSDEVCIVVLDEMNIARVEYYFADFLSLMELNEDSRFLEMTSDVWPKDPSHFKGGRFRIPDNVWFIGTANNDDSTFAISDKVYDRAMIVNLDRKARPFHASPSEGFRMSASFFKQITEDAKRTFEMTSRARRKVAEIDRFMTEKYHVTYGNRIRRQMEEYVALYIACGGTEEEALDDFLMKKVFRKLEGQNPVVLAKIGIALEEKLNELFREDSMPLCRNYLQYLRQLAS